MESVHASVGSMLTGTWASLAIYKPFGASAGRFTVVRKGPAVTVPDMLTCGDM